MKLFSTSHLFVEILGRKGSGTMIFIVSWCYRGLAMVVFISFWQGSYPPSWHHTGMSNSGVLPLLLSCVQCTEMRKHPGIIYSCEQCVHPKYPATPFCSIAWCSVNTQPFVQPTVPRPQTGSPRHLIPL